MSDPKDQKQRRVGEALASEGDGIADDLDPALLARLEAWFSGPAGGPPPPAEAPARKDPRSRTPRERALDAVDPGLLGRLEDQGERAGDMVTPPPAPKTTLDPSIAQFDFAVWGLQGIGEPRDYERPDDVPFALQEKTPQALLRDLHRPVRDYGDILLRPMDLGLDPTGARVRATIDEMVCRRRYVVRIDQEPIPRRMMCEDAEDLRDLLDRPWEDSKPEKPRPLPSEHPDANDMRWFGSIGIDPDQ